MFNILAIGDPHFQTDNIQEVDLFISKLIPFIESRNFDYIICMGDLLHTHEKVNSMVMNKAYEFVLKISKIAKLYILVGNHDMYSNQQFLNDNHWMNGMKKWDNVEIIDNVKMINNILFCPFVANGRFIEAISRIDNWENVDCIFAHQEFFGCKMGGIISETGDKWDLNLPTVISGHIHTKHSPQKNIIYIGSALQHAFGENEDNTIADITIVDKFITITDIDLGMTRKKILYSTINDIDKLKISENEKIKITLSGDLNEYKSFKKSEKFKELIKSGVKIVFKQNVIEKEISNNDSLDFVTILYNLMENDEMTRNLNILLKTIG